MTTICSSSVSRNFLNYYLVKWGLRKAGRLILKTSPDPIVLDLNTDQVRYNKGLLKSIFRLVRNREIKYYADTNKMLVYDKSKKKGKELNLDLDALETIETILSLGIDFQDIDYNLFQVNLNSQLKFLIRKFPASDIKILKETIIDGEYAFLYPHVKNKTVVDIGAFIGDTAAMFCLNGAKSVFAYEPDHFLFNLCVRNVELNHLGEKVRVENYGVSNKEYSLDEKGYSFVKSELLFDRKKNSGNSDMQIKILAFSKLIAGMDEIGVLKMDCEGAEFKAILSTPIPIFRKIKVVGIECHADPKPLIDYFEKAGFKVEIKKEIKTYDRNLTILFAAQEDKKT
jgi:FkbM family methyltransferase